MMAFFSENIFLIAQAIGVVALILSTLKFQFKRPHTIGLVNCCSSSLWAVHNFMLGGVSGAVISFINVIRIFACLNVTYSMRKYVFYVTATLAALITFYMSEGIIAVLPFFAFCSAGYAYVLLDRPVLMRAMLIVGEILWMIYAVYIFSIPMALACALGIVSSFIGLYRFERDKIIEIYGRVFLRTYP